MNIEVKRTGENTVHVVAGCQRGELTISDARTLSIALDCAIVAQWEDRYWEKPQRGTFSWIGKTYQIHGISPASLRIEGRPGCYYWKFSRADCKLPHCLRDGLKVESPTPERSFAVDSLISLDGTWVYQQ